MMGKTEFSSSATEDCVDSILKRNAVLPEAPSAKCCDKRAGREISMPHYEPRLKDQYANVHVGHVGRHGNGSACRHLASLLQTPTVNSVVTISFSS